MKTEPPLHLEPILVSCETAARLCGVSRSTFLNWDAVGACPRSVRPAAGGRVLWPVEAIRTWAMQGCPSREQEATP